MQGGILGEPLPINIDPIQPNDVAPSDGEIREAAGGLTNGGAAGTSRMQAEDVKAWLHVIKLEEDPEVGPNNIGVGGCLCRLFGIMGRSPPSSCG